MTDSEPNVEAARLLGPLEAETLACVRRLGPSTVAEVTEQINSVRPERPLAYRTLLTVLTHLEAKGVLDHTKQGRAFRYAATKTDEEYLADRAAQASRTLLSRFGDAAVAGFVSEVVSDPRQRALLEELLGERAEQSEPGGQHGRPEA